jgi:hypothetical protein
MASVKRDVAGEASSPKQESGRVPKVERETMPAPSLGDRASARPTAMPPFDVSALAAGAGLRHERAPRMPLGLAVPVRSVAAIPRGLDLRLSFLLLHVDGRASIAEIAALVQLTGREVEDAFAELLRLGLVAILGDQRACATPDSRTVPRDEDDDD